MKTIAKITATLFALAFTLTACGTYDHKDYPRQSWFDAPVRFIDADAFKKTEAPINIALTIHYTFDGIPVTADKPNWREADGIRHATKRYLEETGLFIVVDEEEEVQQGKAEKQREVQGEMVIDLTRARSEKTKAAVAAKAADPNNYPEKIIYEYEMALRMVLDVNGKRFTGTSSTERMFIGHDDSEALKTANAPERFTFSYFNNLDFHTEFVRRFYRQMLFEALRQVEAGL